MQPSGQSSGNSSGKKASNAAAMASIRELSKVSMFGVREFLTMARRETAASLGSSDASIAKSPVDGGYHFEGDAKTWHFVRSLSVQLADESDLQVVLEITWHAAARDGWIGVKASRRLNGGRRLEAKPTRARVQLPAGCPVPQILAKLRTYSIDARLKHLDLTPLKLHQKGRPTRVGGVRSRSDEHCAKLFEHGPVSMSNDLIDVLLRDVSQAVDADEFSLMADLRLQDSMSRLQQSAKDAMSARIHLGLKALISMPEFLVLVGDAPAVSAESLRALAITRFTLTADGEPEIDFEHFCQAYRAQHEVADRRTARTEKAGKV